MSDQPSQSPKKKFRRFKAVIKEHIPETHDSATLILETDEEKDYKAGQFISIDPNQFPALERWANYLAKLKGRREPPRQYSLASAPYEPILAVTIKEEHYDPEHALYPPLLSPYLTYRPPVGMEIEVMGYTGPYTLPDDIESKTDRILHICSGSGCVPNFSIMKQCLHDNSSLKHTLIYGNKTYDDIIYRDRFDQLAAEHPGKIEIIHSISREETPEEYGPNYRKGRVSEELLRAHITDPASTYVYACGAAISPWERKAAKESGATPSPKFMEGVLAALEAVGVPKENVHKESWG